MGFAFKLAIPSIQNRGGIKMETIEAEDLRQSPEYKKYMESIGWRVVGPVFIRRLGPVSIAKIQRVELPLDWGKINKVLRENRVFMCKLEPINRITNNELRIRGFRQDNWPLLGSKTLRVDLKPSEEKILASFMKDCRYVLRKIEDRKLKIEKNDFEKFYEIWKSSARRKNLWIPKKKEYDSLIKCFGKKAFCVCLEDPAGAVVLTHKKIAYYYYAGATKKGNELNLPYLVAWEVMKEAKERGCVVWDWEGIYDARWPNKGWVGFSHFKKSFGGKEIEFPGSFTRWRWPF